MCAANYLLNTGEGNDTELDSLISETTSAATTKSPIGGADCLHFCFRLSLISKALTTGATDLTLLGRLFCLPCLHLTPAIASTSAITLALFDMAQTGLTRFQRRKTDWHSKVLSTNTEEPETHRPSVPIQQRIQREAGLTTFCCLFVVTATIQFSYNFMYIHLNTHHASSGLQMVLSAYFAITTTYVFVAHRGAPFNYDALSTLLKESCHNPYKYYFGTQQRIQQTCFAVFSLVTQIYLSILNSKTTLYDFLNLLPGIEVDPHELNWPHYLNALIAALFTITITLPIIGVSFSNSEQNSDTHPTALPLDNEPLLDKIYLVPSGLFHPVLQLSREPAKQGWGPYLLNLADAGVGGVLLNTLAITTATPGLSEETTTLPVFIAIATICAIGAWPTFASSQQNDPTINHKLKKTLEDAIKDLIAETSADNVEELYALTLRISTIEAIIAQRPQARIEAIVFGMTTYLLEQRERERESEPSQNDIIEAVTATLTMPNLSP